MWHPGCACCWWHQGAYSVPCHGYKHDSWAAIKARQDLQASKQRSCWQHQRPVGRAYAGYSKSSSIAVFYFSADFRALEAGGKVLLCMRRVPGNQLRLLEDISGP
eukprot:symbB.v1.2.030781.t1/scaffold3506.1/size55141/4